jgi:RNA polymerase sigma-70 factor, ECF subfamily
MLFLRTCGCHYDFLEICFYQPIRRNLSDLPASGAPRGVSSLDLRSWFSSPDLFLWGARVIKRTLLDDNRRGLIFELLKSIAERRDIAAFNTLLEHYDQRLQRFAILRGASKDLAEDISQQTLFTAGRKACLYSRDKGAVSAWIFTIAHRPSIDQFRKVGGGGHAPVELAENIPSGDIRADDQVASRQCDDHVKAALAALSTSQREGLDPAFFKGLYHSQIANRLSLPLGTIKSRIRPAYQHARLALEGLR